MSFLSKLTPIARPVLRPSPRLFSTAVVYQKSATETIKDGLKAVDRTVSDAVVSGIDKGVETKEKAASTIGINVDKAKGEASQKMGEAQGKAAELKGEAKGKANEVAGEVKQQTS